MTYDIARSFEYLEKVVRSKTDVERGMSLLISHCEAQIPNNLWTSIRKFNFKRDTINLRLWLEELLQNEPPPNEIRAFWFGLFNPILDDKQASCGLYVSGSVEFDPEDETGDWACWTDDSYLPAKRYANSKILQDVYRTTVQTEVSHIGEYILCLGYACLAVKEICQAIEPDVLLGKRASRAVAVGFDSGDFILLGSISRSGLL